MQACAACAGSSSRSLRAGNIRRCTGPALLTRRLGTAPDDDESSSKTSSPQLQLAHTAHAPAHGIGADLLAREQDGAAARATQQLNLCSPGRLPRKAYALARAALAAPFSPLILRFGQLSPLYRLHRTGTSRADAALEARKLARSRFVLRAGCGRGMCD